MSEKVLFENSIVEAKIKEEIIDEKTKERTITAEVKWQMADSINHNGRRYKKSLLQREIDRLLPSVREGKVWGASYHPQGEAEIDDVSHVWTDIYMESNGSCCGLVKILPTERGKNLMTVIKHGKVGLSSRGTGTVTKKTEMIKGRETTFDDVNEDYKMISPGDFVLSPSVPDAEILATMEKKIEEKVKVEEENTRRSYFIQEEKLSGGRILK